jgi:hypothetical protein
VEKSQYELCLAVLRRLADAKILEQVVVIGSWCLVFYQEYFAGIPYAPNIRTRDVDLLLPAPMKLGSTTSLPAILKDLGFVSDLVATTEFAKRPLVKLVHPELIVELLVSAKGSGQVEPYAIPKLNMTAQGLPFLYFLALRTVQVTVQDLTITLPHPAYFAVHKLLVATRRPVHQEDKKGKDVQHACDVTTALQAKREQVLLRDAVQELPPKAQNSVKKLLLTKGLGNLLSIFEF